jgi:hypothetical protein
MDKELGEAQSLTKDDLVSKLEAGRPAKLARRPAPRDPNQRARATVNAVIARTEREEPKIFEFHHFPPMPLSMVKIVEEPRIEEPVRTSD